MGLCSTWDCVLDEIVFLKRLERFKNLGEAYNSGGVRRRKVLVYLLTRTQLALWFVFWCSETCPGTARVSLCHLRHLCHLLRVWVTTCPYLVGNMPIFGGLQHAHIWWVWTHKNEKRWAFACHFLKASLSSGYNQQPRMKMIIFQNTLILFHRLSRT